MDPSTAAPDPARPFGAGWNFADAWEVNAERFPEAAAQAQGDRRFTWREFDQRADGVAAALLAAGLTHQDKVAQYLYNCPEYLESVYACFKAGFVPVNTNYRYTDHELEYLWDNSDTAAVVFHGAFAEHVEHLRARLPKVKAWLWVDDGTGPKPGWALDYEQAAKTGASVGRQRAPWGRSGDDLFLLYTGGTTGAPKGVMWRQDDLLLQIDSAAKRALPDSASREAMEQRVGKPGVVVIPAAPLMHGTGAFNAMGVLLVAGCVVTMQGRHFDPVELLDTIDRFGATTMSIVGDAFAKPLVRALDGHPGRWDFSSMRVIVSSGVIWSAETKAALLRHNPRLLLMDNLGSSEAIGMASSTTSAEGTAGTATFKLGRNARVIDDDGRDVVPGSGQRGRVAIRGRTPIGYYKDPEKSAATFAVIDGVRYSIPGDFAEVEADGTLRLLGRGSQCINTGGEKVYPEEVEEALKRHPAVRDAVVVGVPDERFGEAVTALVEGDGPGAVGDAELIAFVREELAAYKSPKRILWIDSVNRAPNGKIDYRALKARAVAELHP